MYEALPGLKSFADLGVIFFILPQTFSSLLITPRSFPSIWKLCQECLTMLGCLILCWQLRPHKLDVLSPQAQAEPSTETAFPTEQRAQARHQGQASWESPPSSVWSGNPLLPTAHFWDVFKFWYDFSSCAEASAWLSLSHRHGTQCQFDWNWQMWECRPEPSRSRALDCWASGWWRVCCLLAAVEFQLFCDC